VEEHIATSPAPADAGDHQQLLDAHPVAWRISIVLWVVCAFLFVALAVPVTRDAVQGVDDVVYRAAANAEFAPAVAVAKGLDFIGGTWVTAPVIVLVGVWLALRRRWRALTFWIVAMVLSQLAIGPVKDLYQRARPPFPLVATSSWSFPSGHSVATATIALAAVIVLVPASPKRRNLEMLAAVFAIVMALSRVYLRAHWLSDVAAGVALGVAIALGTAAIIQWFDHRRRARITAAASEP
jgi:membrane-associated phospholipid phosphatase